MEIEDLPDSIVLNILTYLTCPFDVSKFGQCSRKCRRVSNDDLLWRDLFHRYYRVQNHFSKPLGHTLWRDEFVRMLDETPLVEVEVKKRHHDQVLHVSFSKNGNMFCTTSKDAQVLVWTSDHPVKLKWEYNMKKFQWKYTQYSEFNESDTLLLVSGVLFGLQSTSGEIVIFNLKDFQIQCRIVNKPYDIFGTFISDNFFLSGDLTWLGTLVSKTQIWLNKASQEIESEHTAIMNKMFKFYNPNASSVRSLMIANVVRDSSSTSENEDNQENEEQEASSSSTGPKNLENLNIHKENESGNRPSSHSLLRQVQTNVDDEESKAFLRSTENENVADINYSPEFYSYLTEKEKECSESEEHEEVLNKKIMENDSEDDGESSSSRSRCKNLNNEELKKQLDKESYETFYDEVIDTEDKYLIFTCGQKTYTPHQIGFRKIGKNHLFKGRIDCSIPLDQRIKEYKRRKLLENSGQVDNNEIDYSNYPKVEHLFDKIDHTIDLHGHIIGMKLSPDHKYLYVNSRPWPKNYYISDPLNPPPIAQEIDVHCIDMVTLRQVGTMRRCHKGYTPNDECFFLFLDTSELYLGSGAEDQHGYIWDRLYGISLFKLPHTDVVNCVGFCPKDSELLVSVSDDNSIKIWRSKRKCRELGINYTDKNQGIKLYKKEN